MPEKRQPDREVRCRRAREWASLRLDGELSELEIRLLERHLSGCVQCRSLAESVTRATQLMRAVPLEAPLAPTVLPERVVRLPARRRLVMALVAAALLLGTLAGSIERPESVEPGPELGFLDTEIPAGTADTDRQRLQRLRLPFVPPGTV